MLHTFLEQAKADQPVYITDVRNTFNSCGTRPFSLHLTMYNGDIRIFPLRLAETDTPEEEEFVSGYVYAMVYNLLSSLGGVKMDIYLDPADEKSVSLAESLDAVFQTDASKSVRSGYGKCLNVNERVIRTLSGTDRRFGFYIRDCARCVKSDCTPPMSEGSGGVEDRLRTLFADKEKNADFEALPAMAETRMLLGIDVGGTDIKLAAGVDGQLAVCKEYDWFPAGFTQVEQMTGPIMQMIRLMRAAANLFKAGKKDELYADPAASLALEKDASTGQMEEGIRSMETMLADEPENFDAIGLSFPDVVIRNLITGGECNKFKGMRDNKDLDFEEQYAKVTALGDLLKTYVKPDGAVMIANDGPMAAFTAAVELAAAGADVSDGFFAHTLGTELGTGWVLPDGSIPEIPLEVYNFIIDLGSFVQKTYGHDDVRSINNLNTDLPGTLQKYTGQSGVFRLAAKYLPEEEPALYEEAFEKGFFKWEGDALCVPTAPKDMRKDALEFFMQKAADGSSPACERIFREIGTYLAVTWQETDYILDPQAKERPLFGRLVKMPACFDLMDEGAKMRVPAIRQYAADSSLANTGLMKQLDADPKCTVAQFAQAVGAVYFGCAGLYRNGTGLPCGQVLKKQVDAKPHYGV